MNAGKPFVPLTFKISSLEIPFMIQAGFIQAFYPHTLSFQLQLFFSSLHFFLILQVIILKPFLFNRQKFRGFKVYFEMKFY